LYNRWIVRWYYRRHKWMQKGDAIIPDKQMPFVTRRRYAKILSTLRAAYENPEVDPMLTINNLLTISNGFNKKLFNSHKVLEVDFVISKFKKSRFKIKKRIEIHEKYFC